MYWVIYPRHLTKSESGGEILGIKTVLFSHSASHSKNSSGLGPVHSLSHVIGHQNMHMALDFFVLTQERAGVCTCNAAVD